MKTITSVNVEEFEGIPSGDGEAACWDVDAKAFKRYEEEEPTEFEKSFFNDGFYRCYHAPIPVHPDFNKDTLYSIRVMTNKYGDGSISISINAEVIRRIHREN